MANLLEQLENNEAVLLMYLADELPARDRAEVEQQLSTDAGLRAERDRLIALNQEIFAGLTALDGVDRPLASQKARAVKAVGREVVRAQMARQARPVPAPARNATPAGLRWMYPAAAAAALLIGFVTWAILAGGPQSTRSESGVRPIAQRPTLPKHGLEDRPGFRLPQEAVADSAGKAGEKTTDGGDALLNEAQDQVAALTDQRQDHDPADFFGKTVDEQP